MPEETQKPVKIEEKNNIEKKEETEKTKKTKKTVKVLKENR